MNGFLVLLCHTMDDIPVRLCETEAEAMRVAEGLDWDKDPTPELLKAVDAPACSTPVNIRCVEFRDGVPVRGWELRNCESEDEAEYAKKA